MGDPKPLSLTEVDHLMAATQHALKSQMEGTPEAALFALFASTWRQSSSPSQPAGARSRSLTVLVGDGVTVGSEIVSLTSAYDSMVPSVVGSDAPAATRARDHMLSAQPWITEQPISTIPYPFIDCRRVRLVPAGNALVGAVLVSGSGARVAIGTGNVEDPHTPIQAEGTPYKLAKKRRWSHTVQHAAVAGSDAVARPRILDLAPSYSAVRISGVKYDTGTTAGYWEALYRIGRGRRVTLRGAAADRVSDLSARALAVVTEAERLLFVPVQLLYDEQRDAFRKPLARAQARLRALLGHESLQAVLDLVADPPNTEAEQIALHAMAARGLRVIWQETASTVPDPLRVARANLELSRRLQNAFQENLMTAPEMSTLAKRVHAVLYSMDAHLTPDNRARIRSAATNLPLDAYVALAEVPADEMEQLVTRRVWETAIRGLSVVHQGGPSVGDVLAGTDYPAARVSALLSSRHPGRPHRRGREVARVARRRAGVAHRLSRSRPRRCQQ